MGKATGFLEIHRQVSQEIEPLERIQDFHEFHKPLSQKHQSCQGARCMDCGVPFCQNGQMLDGVVSGCPLNNLIPEWNDLIFHENWTKYPFYGIMKKCAISQHFNTDSGR